ncbi:TPA: hypothetical protein ACXNZR_000437 [Klebsiella aerogenes]|uniref:hypothetical protein n=1 Tax=Klebsiella aerogenes TaxID=548 RepID=UPI002ABBFF6D|nr:hypothetical protein [Klebsiella aerogenes]EMA4693229.1 hypothetical protein [Klebsiella aerogenes]WVJ32715.1 hypothetical protein V1231_10745 [Klebsiella aerogenes]
MLKKSDIRSAFIVREGDAIEGDALIDVELIGVDIHIISKAGFDGSRVMCWWSGNWIGSGAACAT